MTKKKTSNVIIFCILCVLVVAFLTPIFFVLINSFKGKLFISNNPFALPTAETFAGLTNYVNGIEKTGFFTAFGWSAFITVFSVAVIILFTSMTAYYLTRVKTGVTNVLYYMFVFSMIVPFQMVMFTMSKLANMTHLNNPPGMVLLYLGFGSGLSVFMFCGFIKSIPLDIEEAAMIDGCGPFRILTSIIIPMCKPGIVTVCMISAMAAWNEYPVALVMVTDPTKATLPVGLANLYEIQRYATDWGALFAALVLALIPTVILFIVGQKQLVQGLSVGGVKG